jgi:hypothetical protein
VAKYRVEDEPRYEFHGDGLPLPGHYETELSTEQGQRLVRYLTDKGRAEILRMLADGRHELSQAEVDDHTVEPDLDALVARMVREGGEGS